MRLLLPVAVTESVRAAPEVSRAIDTAVPRISSTETRTQSKAICSRPSFGASPISIWSWGGIVQRGVLCADAGDWRAHDGSRCVSVPELAVQRRWGSRDTHAMALILVEAVVFCVFWRASGWGWRSF